MEAVATAGGAPVLIPLNLDEGALRAIYERLNGLLLAGGEDVHPRRYGEAIHEKCGQSDEARDAVELTLARWALAEGLPVLGLCRGIQVLNVAAGGTLYQDIASQVAGSLKHDCWPDYPRNYLAHQVTVNDDSLMAAVLGHRRIGVNSTHHQAVKDLAPRFRVVARATDGVIDAIEGHDGVPFILGVQWHPEELVEDAPPMRRLFEDFVSAARS
ncbi:MAG: gamma-glutamyl-gamma-aminobutyrate hydrolase family protein [Anaerolineae bacterium]